MVVSRVPVVHLALLLFLGVLFAGCLLDEGLDHEAIERERVAARLAELGRDYNNGTGRLLGLSDFPSGADWIALDLVVAAPVDDLRIELTGTPASAGPGGVSDPYACLNVFYDGVGGWIGYWGEGYTFDTHQLTVPGPHMPTAGAGDGGEPSFEAPEPLKDHRVLVAVDDVAAWLERGEDFDIVVPDDVQVFWRIADHGDADCVLHFDGFTDDGRGARLGGVGAGVDLYRKWQSAEGGWMGVLFQADLDYLVYVVWQDQYAWSEWDSETSLATGGGYAVMLTEPGSWGVYAPRFAGAEDTYLRVFFADGFESLV